MTQDAGGEIGGYGVTAKGVPTWALGIATVVLTLLIGGPVGRRLWPETHVADAAAAEESTRTIAEFARHIGEAPETEAVLRATPTGRIVVRLYRDNCLFPIWAPTVGEPRSVLMPDITRGASPVVRAWFAAPVAAAAVGSRCDVVAHGSVVRQERSQQGRWTFAHYWFADGCEAVIAMDERGVVYAPTWLVCRH